MGETGATTRPAVKRDVKEIGGVLARAFEHDPPMIWILPDGASRVRRLRRLFTAMLRHEILRHGGVEVACDADGRIVGAALWLPPEKWRPASLSRQLLTLPAYVRALGGGFGRGSVMVNIAMKDHPAEPHWYLSVIGVDPRAQGTGAGAALLRSRLNRCDAEGLAAYLESSKPANVPVYEHFGFAVAETLPLPEGAPVVTRMWRDPGAGR